MLDKIVRGGIVVSSEGMTEADIGIKDQKVVLMGDAAQFPEAETTIEINKQYVLPGLIDPHTHFGVEFMGTVAGDDFFTGTRAAAMGGTTTFIDFAIQKVGKLPMEAIESHNKKAKGMAVIDYSFHSVIVDASPPTLDQIKDLVDLGIPSFKCFMIYRKDNWMADDGVIVALMQELRKHGGIIGAHAENEAIMNYNIQRALAAGNRAPIYHALTKPNLCEAEAINRAVYLAMATRQSYYNYHMTCREGVDIIRETRAKGHPAYAETCTHYLTLTKEKLEGPNGMDYICSPPLRDQEDIESLWDGIGDGTVSTVGSDNAAFTHEMKMVNDSFDQIPNGTPGVEFRLPTLYTEGVLKGRIDLCRLVAISSTNVAKIFGLYPKKGVIAPGSDADLVVLDTEKEKTLTVKDSLIDCDWHPYEGMTFKGWPHLVISKGKIVAEKDIFTGQKGAGEFLKRKIADDILSRPAL